MRSKTILAAALATALGASFSAFADDSDSYGSRSPPAGAPADNGTSVRGPAGSTDRSASSSYGRDQEARNDDRDPDRGRDPEQRHPNTRNDARNDPGASNADNPDARSGNATSQLEGTSNPY
jgi:hypothetical protein